MNFKKINFDSDALNLKNQESQSVLLAKEVIEKNPTSVVIDCNGVGYEVNISLNTFSQIKDLAAMHDTLSEWGVALNTQGGEIKGSPALYLEQSTTVAAQMPVEFSDHETLSVPSGYYEFMRRYQQKDGNIYQGFCADLEVALLDSP